MSKGCSNAPLCTGDASAARRGAPVNPSTASVDTAIDKTIDSGHLIRRPIRIAGIAPSEIPPRVERQPERAPRERDRHRPRTPVRPPRRACLHQQRDTVSRDEQDRRRHDRARGRDQWSTRRCVQHCMRDVSRNRRARRGKQRAPKEPDGPLVRAGHDQRLTVVSALNRSSPTKPGGIASGAACVVAQNPTATATNAAPRPRRHGR